MVDQGEVRKALSKVMDPELGRSLEELGMIKEVKVDGGKVEVTVALTTPSCPLRGGIEADVKQAVAAVPGVEDVQVRMGQLSPEELAKISGGPGAEGGPTQAQQLSHIGVVVAVMSGKGGVGKSMVTSMLAVSLAREGKKVGILDADITGPSIPRMFGLKGQADASEFGIIPVATPDLGIQVMSINLLLGQEDLPVIWRGPLISGAIRQFWTDVVWGDLDVLLVDLPPGTSDAPLTVMQALPLSGAVVVSTPQDLAGMVVRKAVKMANQLGIPILGVVENMSYFACPESGKRHEVFGPSRGEELARAADAPLLARLPIDPQLARLSDAGRIEDYRSDDFVAMARTMLEGIKKGAGV
ncbi:MAG TPA: Mrp/NBP35 family ATP-binding protein [Bacillota bacterium]|jgi:Mrp family chromosome partitioning ATPase